MTNTKFTDLPDGWVVEIADNATIFLQYRDVDLAAIWLPFDSADAYPTITVPSVHQLRDRCRDIIEHGDTEPPTTEWAVSDEEIINLIDHVQIVDSIQAQLGVNRAEKERKDRLAQIVDAIRADGTDRERRLLQELNL